MRDSGEFDSHKGRSLLVLLLLVGGIGLSWASPAQDRPNLVFIWADNLGYGDLGCYGSRLIRTPVLDRLATNGVRLTQFYVAHTVCSPSRAALLTGRQPFRVGITDVLRPDGPSGLPADEITLAEILREQGYATVCIGKWHLGDRPEFLPLQHGFDRYFGLPYSMDMLPHTLYRDNQIIERDADVVNITERYTDEAIQFIIANKDRPFFLYFAHTIPHPPLRLPEKHRSPDLPIYVDAIQHMDQQVGRVLEVLEQNGLREKTLVIFTSDNGPMGRGSSAGLRGGIRDYYEGGIRVPFIASQPGSLPAGRVGNIPVIAYDIFPTLVELAGGRVPDDRIYDGQKIWPVLTGEGHFERHKPFFFVYDDLVCAIRDGRWKLHVAHRGQPLRSPQLYDLDRDPEEAYPINDRYPKIVKRLQEKVREFQSEVPKVWRLNYPVRNPAKRPSGVDRQ